MSSAIYNQISSNEKNQKSLINEFNNIQKQLVTNEKGQQDLKQDAQINMTSANYNNSKKLKNLNTQS